MIGTLSIDNTGGEYIFKILSTDITNATGIHDLYMVFKGEDKVSLAKFDHWRFVDEKGADAIRHQSRLLYRHQVWLLL